MLRVKDIGIQWFDVANDRLLFLYAYEHGARLNLAPISLPKSARRFIQTRQPELYRTAAEQIAAGVGAVPGTDQSLSNVMVPIIGSDRVLGIVAMENYERENAYGEPELRLLQTIAASLGVALENARLFDETQRLLKETEQRNAELAVINSIQQAVGSALDFQAIVDVVGDKLREVFATGDMAIRWWDEETRLDTRLYCYEHGVRLNIPPRVVEPDGLVARFYRERKVWLVNSRAEQAARGITAMPGTDQSRSIVSVPMMAGERIFGAVMLEDHERDNAFGPAEVRLLETITASMAVALLNARSYEAERQRAAELAIINAVQQALAGELSLQGVYDAVGEKLREVLPGLVRGHPHLRPDDRARELSRTPTTTTSAASSTHEPLGDQGFGPHVLRTGKTLVINEGMDEASRAYGSYMLARRVGAQVAADGAADGGYRGTRPDPAERRAPRACLRRSSGAAARNPCRQHERGARERPPLRRDAAAAEGDRSAQHRARGDQQHPGRHGQELNFQAIIDLVGDTLRKSVRLRHLGIFWLDERRV